MSIRRMLSAMALAALTLMSVTLDATTAIAAGGGCAEYMCGTNHNQVLV